MQQKDPFFGPIYKKCQQTKVCVENKDKFIIYENLLFYVSSFKNELIYYRICVPFLSAYNVIISSHQYMGHIKKIKMINILNSKFYIRDIDNLCQTQSTVYLRPLKDIKLDDPEIQTKVFQDLLSKNKRVPVYSADITRVKLYKPLLLDNYEYLHYSKCFSLPKPLYIGSKCDKYYISENIQFFSESPDSFLSCHDSDLMLGDKILNVNYCMSQALKPILKSERSQNIKNLAIKAREMYNLPVTNKKVSFSKDVKVFIINSCYNIYYCKPATDVSLPAPRSKAWLSCEQL